VRAFDHFKQVVAAHDGPRRPLVNSIRETSETRSVQTVQTVLLVYRAAVRLQTSDAGPRYQGIRSSRARSVSMTRSVSVTRFPLARSSVTRRV